MVICFENKSNICGYSLDVLVVCWSVSRFSEVFGRVGIGLDRLDEFGCVQMRFDALERFWDAVQPYKTIPSAQGYIPYTRVSILSSRFSTLPRP